MILKKAITLFLILFALSLFAFAFLGNSLIDFLKLFSVDVALTILFIIIYPYVKKVKKGDSVVVISNSLMPSLFGRTGVVTSQVKGLHNKIKVRLDDGTEVIGVLESYADLFSLPRVRLIYEEKLER